MRLNYEKFKVHSFIDVKLLLIILLLMSTSIVAIVGSTPYLAENFTMKSLLLKQLMWYVVGLIVMGVFIYNGNDYVVQLFKLFYIILMGMLVILLFDLVIFQKIWTRGFTLGSFDPILKINGATSWFNIPGIGSFQPSEFMKICLIVLNADIIAKHNQNREQSSYIDDLGLLIKMAKISLPPMLLIFLQPDTGLVFVMIFGLFFMVCASGINKGWLISIGTLMVIVISVFFYFIFLFTKHIT